MSKIYDTTKILDASYLTSQTPKNNNKQDYWSQQLQEKINHDWDYIPNRVDVEKELKRGVNQYEPLEVVIQTIKSDKGQVEVSDDYRRLVFKDIATHCDLGTKFKFSYNFNLQEDDNEKDIWLAGNKNSINQTSSVTIVRCNNTIKSTYQNKYGVTEYHTEPVIFTQDLRTVNLFYNDVITTARASLIAICQHNSFTKNYYINQRFVVGYDTVYRIEGFHKFNSTKTYDPYNVGVMLLYLELVEKSVEDDFENRVAHNQELKVVTEESSNLSYSVKLIQPSVIPSGLLSAPIVFTIGVFQGDSIIELPIKVQCSLQNTTNPTNYYELSEIGSNQFTLRRLKFYSGGDLIVKCFVSQEDSPTGEEIYLQFNLNMRGLE